MRILVTRPEPAAFEQGEKLRQLGYDVILSPMLETKFCPVPSLLSDGATATIFTSETALRALENHPDLPLIFNLPCYSVGPATARKLEASGFTNVIEGPGTAAELADLIANTRRPAEGSMLYFAPKDPAFNFKDGLSHSGIQVHKQIVYGTEPVRGLVDEAKKAILTADLDAVILMSKRTAMTFADLVMASGLVEPARKPAYLCLSPTIGEALQSFNPHVIEIAIHPNSEEMLALVHRMAAQLR